MDTETIDLLQIKIEKARAKLSSETQSAINSVDWKKVIADMAGKKGYSLEQLGDLELETELVLVGLAEPKDYPKELQSRMGIGKPQADELVGEMNEKVFKKIRERLIEITERQKPTEVQPEEPAANHVLEQAGIKVVIQTPEAAAATPPVTEDREKTLEKIERPDETHPIIVQKLSGPMQTPAVRTEHVLDTVVKPEIKPEAPVVTETKKVDPYREPIE